jgi:hypothetical protein
VGLLGGDGDSPHSMLYGEVNGLSPTDDGELLIANTDEDHNGIIRMLARKRSRQPALAFRVTLPARRRVSFTITRRARVSLLVRGERHRLLLHTTAGPGLGRFRLPRTLPAGGYELELSAITDNGARLVRRHGVILARELPARVARTVTMWDLELRSIITPEGINARPRSS